MFKKITKIIIAKTGIIQKLSELIYRYHFERERELLEKNYNLNAVIGENCQLDSRILLRNEQNNRSNIVIGANTKIDGAELLIYKQSGKIEIGNYCYIGPNTRIWSSKNVKIGNRVLISYNVSIHDNNSHPLDSVKRHEDFKNILTKSYSESTTFIEKEVTISDDVWIGFNSTILKGVTVGKGAVVAACSVVTVDVPEFAIVAGNPAKIVKQIT